MFLAVPACSPSACVRAGATAGRPVAVDTDWSPACRGSIRPWTPPRILLSARRDMVGSAAEPCANFLGISVQNRLDTGMK
jgi:hypothetical protein